MQQPEYIKKHVESTDIFEFRHESFIIEPKDYLKKLCQFLGVDPSGNYLNDCASIVYKSPHKSRYDIAWDIELINTVKILEIRNLREYYEPPPISRFSTLGERKDPVRI